MNEYVIIEKLKSAINDRKVISAVFYTYNFDAKFFENYLLPLFLPHVNFSEIEIQNSILWRKYVNELPPVTVYCDFHAKNNDAPSLNYTVRAVDIKTTDGHKPCFHPKNAFILLDDGALIVMTGSNNLSISGWCTNIEGLSVFEMKNGEYFPGDLKHQLWTFLYNICETNSFKYTLAEQKIDEFFSQRKHSDHTDKRFYNSTSGNFTKLLSDLIAENDNLPFSRMEVISPFFSKSIDFVKESVKLSKDTVIYALTPYADTNLAGITKETYNDFSAAGIVWSRMIETNNDKLFRFTHSKMYHLKGEKQMYTIIGSANYTEAGWRGTKKNGNIETAIVYTEPLSSWKDWLIEHNNPEIQFPEKIGNEAEIDQRGNVPDINFTLDWLEKKLFYYKSADVFKGVIMLSGKNFEIRTGKKNEIPLNEKQLQTLADNAVIEVHEYITKNEFYFYPLNLNIESKPCSSKIKLNDRELIELWQKVSYKEEDKSEIAELLERFINSRLDTEGELLNKKERSKSTMNLIASHINALIKLEERLFFVPQKVGEYAKSIEILDYYLFTNNIDTISGYRTLLKEMLKETSVLPSVAWFLLNLLLIEFYDISKITKVYGNLRCARADLKNKIEILRAEITEEAKVMKKCLKPGDISEKHYSWILNQIRK